MAGRSPSVCSRRWKPDWQGGLNERDQSPEEIKAAEIVSACGARPLGTQWGLGVTPDLFLFRDAHGGCVGVPLSEISIATVQAKLLQAELRWNGRHRPQKTADSNAAPCQINNRVKSQ